MRVEPLDACFGARVTGVELATLGADEFQELHERWIEDALLVFPAQFLGRDAQVAFARRFGDIEIEMAELSNVRADGALRPDDGTDDMMKVHRGNMGWHHDSTYMPVQAKGAVFSAETVPSSGGATWFADMRAAYDALDAETANRLEGLRAHHSLYYSQSRVGHHAGAVDDPGVEPDESKGQTYGGYGFHKGPIPIRPLVKTHPVTGRKNLLLGRHAYDVDGMTHEESEAFLDDLMERACRPPRTYAHQWEPGDALLWDNRRLMHRASMWPFDEPRVMWHTRIAGDPETEAALSA